MKKILLMTIAGSVALATLLQANEHHEDSKNILDYVDVSGSLLFRYDANFEQGIKHQADGVTPLIQKGKTDPDGEWKLNPKHKYESTLKVSSKPIDGWKATINFSYKFDDTYSKASDSMKAFGVSNFYLSKNFADVANVSAGRIPFANPFADGGRGTGIQADYTVVNGLKVVAEAYDTWTSGGFRDLTYGDKDTKPIKIKDVSTVPNALAAVGVEYSYDNIASAKLYAGYTKDIAAVSFLEVGSTPIEGLSLKAQLAFSSMEKKVRIYQNMAQSVQARSEGASGTSGVYNVNLQYENSGASAKLGYLGNFADGYAVSLGENIFDIEGARATPDFTIFREDSSTKGASLQYVYGKLGYNFDIYSASFTGFFKSVKAGYGKEAKDSAKSKAIKAVNTVELAPSVSVKPAKNLTLALTYIYDMVSSDDKAKSKGKDTQRVRFNASYKF